MSKNSDLQVSGVGSVSLKRRLEIAGLTDPRVYALWFFFIVVIGFFVWPYTIGWSVYLLYIAKASSLVYTLGLFLVGFASGVGTLYLIRYLSRVVLGADRKLAQEVEKRMANGESVDLIDDMNILITENLKLKRYQVAEFYSKQLLEMAERPVRPETIKATSCWINTPEYQKTFRYFFWWLFEHKGTISLNSTHFNLESPKHSFSVPLDKITDISLSRHPLWVKPYPTRYISVTFVEKGFEHTFYLTPIFLQCDTIFDVNKNVSEWQGFLAQARADYKQMQQKAIECREISLLLEDVKRSQAS